MDMKSTGPDMDMSHEEHGPDMDVAVGKSFRTIHFQYL